MIDRIYEAFETRDFPTFLNLLSPVIHTARCSEVPWGGYHGFEEAKAFFGKVNTYDPLSLHIISEIHVNENLPGSNNPQEHPVVFEDRFLRCRPLLQLLAWRILASDEEVEKAVQNCRITASRNPPRFEYEGAFRSWLVRILIEDALAILRENKAALPLSAECLFSQLGSEVGDDG
jgi:hypothetical protein